MGMLLRFPRRHMRASSGSKTRRKSFAVTAPSVTAEIFSATSREGHPLPSQSDVTQPAVTPMETAKSPRLMDLDSRYSANFMAESFSLTKILAQEKILVSLCGPVEESGPKFSMAKPKKKLVKPRFKEAKFQPTFIRQWRKKAGLTLERLADRVGMTGGNLSEIENGNTGYTQATLEALADALGCTAADLLVRDPSDPEGIWSLWEKAKPAERKQLLGIISGFLNSSAA